ncbi:M3 family oligoendopeptidase [Bacillus carboniphilus]|uniref:M3 family oligoendopeptidase n=1 Tax=Bacillus carboniphilus TaxID=86663 RepID=A0ABY9JW72_9BACI|nr:M3 family oligoendopeptidase [Bacillus carboniphilus]WLR42660.1 M3 family oligoendopeptidase [Bacillus carboniphilus]
MKFSQFTYERPNFENTKELFNKALDLFKNATTPEEQIIAMEEFYKIYRNVHSMFSLGFIRHSINTNDAYYEAEQDYIDEFSPKFQDLFSSFYKELIQSTFRPQLEEKWGKHLFDLAEKEIKAFSPDIIEDLQKENKLTSEYSKLIASAKIDFNGDTYTLSQLEPFTQSPDSEIRKQAMEAKFGFFNENVGQFDRIYDDLVKVRTTMAHKLGYDNFVQLGYDRLKRTDYDAKDVRGYRKQVETFIVPLATKLKERQQKRLGLSELKFYDETYEFQTGNAKPKGDPKWIEEQAEIIYKELSKETGEFYSFMKNNELMDLTSKEGKMAGGYCDFIYDYQSPFIFANFNGTTSDVDTLTHEAGHAFQVYSSRHFGVPEYVWPTYEACEIHSMGMEFLTWPWMERLFKEDTEKYKFSHLSSTLLFLPYGVAVDEFQHVIYENPTLTPDERKQAWRDIEKKYLPHRDFDGNAYLESGGFWQRQGHIYEDPFYYIDYTLAQVCAHQLWIKMSQNKEQTWNDYLHLCNLGGSKPFLELVNGANLKSPFEEGTIEMVVSEIEAWLNQVEDENL